MVWVCGRYVCNVDSCANIVPYRGEKRVMNLKRKLVSGFISLSFLIKLVTSLYLKSCYSLWRLKYLPKSDIAVSGVRWSSHESVDGRLASTWDQYLWMVCVVVRLDSWLLVDHWGTRWQRNFKCEAMSCRTRRSWQTRYIYFYILFRIFCVLVCRVAS